MTEQSSITEPAADAAGALDLLLADAALEIGRAHV